MTTNINSYLHHADMNLCFLFTFSVSKTYSYRGINLAGSGYTVVCLIGGTYSKRFMQPLNVLVTLKIQTDFQSYVFDIFSFNTDNTNFSTTGIHKNKSIFVLRIASKTFSLASCLHANINDRLFCV